MMGEGGAVGGFPFNLFGGNDKIDSIIQHIIDNDRNRYGAPPADKDFIETLP